MFRLDWDGESVDDGAENFQQLRNPIKRAIQKLGLEKLFKISKNCKISEKKFKIEPCLEYKLQENVVDSFADEPLISSKIAFLRQ